MFIGLFAVFSFVHGVSGSGTVEVLMGRTSMGTLDGLASLIGFSEACAISAVYGGRELWVSTVFAHNRKLEQLIGEPATRILMREFGGVKGIKVPCLSVFWHYRDVSTACQAVQRGVEVNVVARDLGVSLRTVKYLLVEGRRIGLLAGNKKQRSKQSGIEKPVSSNPRSSIRKKSKKAGSLSAFSPRGSPHPRNSGQFELF